MQQSSVVYKLLKAPFVAVKGSLTRPFLQIKITSRFLPKAQQSFCDSLTARALPTQANFNVIIEK